MNWYRIDYEGGNTPDDAYWRSVMRPRYTQIGDIQLARHRYGPAWIFTPVSEEEVIVQCDLLHAGDKYPSSWLGI